MTNSVYSSNQRKKIAIFSGPEGHLSIAQAIESILSQDYETKLTMVRDGIFSLYTPIYQFFPMAFKVPHKLSEQQTIRNSLRAVFKRKYQPIITNEIADFQPNLTITTHFMYLPGLEKEKVENNLPLLNIVPDPRTIHPILLSQKASANIVFDQQAVAYANNLVPQTENLAMGWFVKPKFQPIKNYVSIRKKLGLKPNIFTIVFSSGSEGTNAILNLIPSLWQLPRACQCVVLCGSNKNLLNTVRAVNRVIKRVNPQVSLIPVGYTHVVHEYYQAADVVAGKAGPNTIFEAIACHKPFLALTHIHGQEDGNLEIIREAGLGWVEENMFKASTLISSLVSNPKLAHNPEKDVKSMAENNRLAGEKLVAEANRLLTK